MGLRGRLFSGEDPITGVGLGSWAHTWGSKRSPVWGLLDFKLALLTSLSPTSEIMNTECLKAELFGS